MVELKINEKSSKGDYNLTETGEEFDFVILLFQRDFYCTNCRNQIQDVEERYDEFVDLNTQVVSVLPENLSRAKDWDEKYDLSYPVVADENKNVSDSFDQPVRFGPLGNLHDLIGRMPLTIILDCRGDSMEVVYREAGSNPSDRPSVDDLLAVLKEERGD